MRQRTVASRNLHVISKLHMIASPHPGASGREEGQLSVDDCCAGSAKLVECLIKERERGNWVRFKMENHLAEDSSRSVFHQASFSEPKHLLYYGAEYRATFRRDWAGAVSWASATRYNSGCCGRSPAPGDSDRQSRDSSGGDARNPIWTNWVNCVLPNVMQNFTPV